MKRQVCVVGLGRFGISVAEALAENGHDVLAIDRYEGNIQQVAPRITHAIQADATNEDVLREIGVSNFDIAIVAIGSSVENSVLATILLKKLGVPRVISRANNELHRMILERIGADMVVSPEQEMGHWIAHGAALTDVSAYMEIESNFGLATVPSPASFTGQTLNDIGFGQKGKWGVAVLLIKRDKEILINPGQNEVVRRGDLLLMAGSDDHMDKLLTEAQKEAQKKRER